MFNVGFNPKDSATQSRIRQEAADMKAIKAALMYALECAKADRKPSAAHLECWAGLTKNVEQPNG